MITPLQHKRLDRLAERIKTLPEERREQLMSEIETEAYNPADVATICGVHAETVRRWIRDGNLKAAKIGHEWRVSRFELAKFWRDRGGGELFGEPNE